MVRGFKIRKEIMEYMRKLALSHYKSLTWEEREVAMKNGDVLLMEKLQVVENESSNGLIYYREMEEFYDKHIKPKNAVRGREKSIEEMCIEEMCRKADEFYADLIKLYGSKVGQGIVYKVNEGLN